MADILQRYGIKEVADVTFYHINKTTNEPDYPVLVLDSLKVTSIEQTAETTEARGGKGNAKLIVWDFGKEITVNIEDALFSPKSLSIMFSDSRLLEDTDATEKGYIKKSARVVATNDGATPTLKLDGKQIEVTEITELKWYIAEEGKVELTEVTETTAFKKGRTYIATWKHPVAAKSIITITPDSFPGTYYVTGDTMIRSERTGEDEYFQFVIAKAKMQAEQLRKESEERRRIEKEQKEFEQLEEDIFTMEDRNTVNKVLQLYENVFYKNIDSFFFDNEFTRGHFKRGIK